MKKNSRFLAGKTFRRVSAATATTTALWLMLAASVTALEDQEAQSAATTASTKNVTIISKLAPARIAPIGTKPEGQTYGRWAAEWWQWGIGTPVSVNPILDLTGENCAQRQVDNVWFLAGTFGTNPVTRKCTVPEGKALFFPLINRAFFAFLNDPPEQRTEEFVREQAECQLPVELFAEINGVEIPPRLLNRFFTGETGSQSPLFNVQLPVDNLFGVTEEIVPQLLLSPSAEEGYYLFVRPLPPGEHTIRWLATGCTVGTVQDITYNLTVTGDSVQDRRVPRLSEIPATTGGLRIPGKQ